MGVFDEGCMGMYNAIIPDHLLNPTGVYKERLSQSALYYEAKQVTRRRGQGGTALDGKKGHDLPYRAEAQNGPDQLPDSRAM